MPIKAYSGGIGQLPLPEIKLSSDIAHGDILTYDAEYKIFRNTLSADISTGKLFLTGAKNAGGVGLVNGTDGRDLELLGLKAGNLIDIVPSMDGNSLVINVSANLDLRHISYIRQLSICLKNKAPANQARGSTPAYQATVWRASLRR